jgi:alpha-amylase
MRTTCRAGPAALLVLLAAVSPGCSSSSASVDPGWKPGQPLTFDVSLAFSAGAVLQDAYGATTAAVAADGTVTVVPDRSGVVLLEQAGAAATPFRWKNALVYFVVTDRFANGDPTNDGSFGRRKDGGQEVATWHGGDLAGLTSKLDYVQGLGATAIWISPFVEQVHGWVSGGSGAFKHWGYHGYWALDFTRVDPSFGTTTELAAFVDGAHARGLRVLADVVMNHPGYATGADLTTYLPSAFFDGTGAAFAAFDASTPTSPTYWQRWNDLVSYPSGAWAGWWSGSWVRAGLGGGYPAPGGTDLTQSLSYLPDFITEGTSAVGLPPLIAGKPDTAAVAQAGFTVRDYLVSWHAGWVRQVGFDGFRCDTAKHVELPAWKALKDAGTAALSGWKAANPGKALDDAPFWMTGEVFGHGVARDAYYSDGGFDSLLNFAFQPALASLLGAGTLPAVAGELDAIYADYAAALSTTAAFDALTYLSSHDTDLFFELVRRDPARMRQAGTALILSPGGVQLFYGDESGRPYGPSGGDSAQATRSDMNWSSTDATLLSHFQKLGAFRKRHAAVGAGTHRRLPSPAGTYGFVRRLSDGTVDDTVAVFLVPPG